MPKPENCQKTWLQAFDYIKSEYICYSIKFCDLRRGFEASHSYYYSALEALFYTESFFNR